jgi:D-alanyl-D-alanine carboxypeptidase/D-alanyl-D-alanine-endopeptidase (penicillin-binding protein 4)
MLSVLRVRPEGRVLLVVLLCLTISATGALAQKAPASNKQLRRAIDGLLNVEMFENATWGVHIIDLDRNRTLYARNSTKSFAPASNMKLFTSAAALDLLGPEFQYETDLFAIGEVSDSVLHGHLVVRGSGDPTIGGQFADGDVTGTFRHWVDSLRAYGIARVTGDIIGDDDVFDDVPLGPGWFWDDEVYSYSAEISGLAFNKNCVDITLRSTYVGGPAHLSWAPSNTDYVELVNQSVTVHADSACEEG